MRAPLLLATVLLVALSACSDTSPTVVVQFPGAPPLQVEIADEPAERERGLMFHNALAPGEGMLFVFPEERPWGFWMRNVGFPIDIVWLNASATVVHVQRVPPCPADPCPIYEPPAPALYVVETPAGFAANHSIGPGVRAGLPGDLRAR